MSNCVRNGYVHIHSATNGLAQNHAQDGRLAEKIFVFQGDILLVRR
jgi:hypothetical protein